MQARPNTASDKQILLRAEQTDGATSVIESIMPPHAPGPPLHKHDFHEAFYILGGELTIQVGEELHVIRQGELAIAPRGVPHTLANHTEAPVRFLIICTPAGFERQLARRAAAQAGIDPPDWALQPIPEVTYVGPPIDDHRQGSRN
jgi:quercetin dioxygenase-like cupin family protein